MANKDELAAMLGRRAWFNVPPADILPRSKGDIDYGDGRNVGALPLRMKFWADHASYPFRSHDLWILTENIRWGVLPPDLDTTALIAASGRRVTLIGAEPGAPYDRVALSRFLAGGMAAGG